MGDRVSIAFKNNGEESITLFSHWGGMGFVQKARKYVRDLKKEIDEKNLKPYPLGRLEPDTVMVDFIRFITSGEERITSDLYVGKDENCGDNSDNGHHIINLN